MTEKYTWSTEVPSTLGLVQQEPSTSLYLKKSIVFIEIAKKMTYKPILLDSGPKHQTTNSAHELLKNDQ